MFLLNMVVMGQVQVAVFLLALAFVRFSLNFDLGAESPSFYCFDPSQVWVRAVR